MWWRKKDLKADPEREAVSLSVSLTRTKLTKLQEAADHLSEQVLKDTLENKK